MDGEEGTGMEFQEEGENSGPGSLEIDRVTGGEGAEANSHSIEMVPSIQCSDPNTAITRSSFTTVSPEVSLFNNNISLFGRLDINGECLGSGSLTNSKISEKLREQFNEMRQYEVKEPVGCAVLIGCKGPESWKLSDSVFRDIKLMEEALNKTGQWKMMRITCMEQKGLTPIKLKREINDIQLQDLEQYSVFLLYFSGHGNHEGVVLSDDGTLGYKDIVRQVASFDALKGKPKVFIFDSCRSFPRGNVKKRLEFKEFPPPDTILCFSTLPYCESKLENSSNSFYTLALAHSIGMFGGKFSFQEIVTYSSHITQAINNSFNNSDEQNKGSPPKQLPMFSSTLDKLLILSANRAYESTGIAPSPVEEMSSLGGMKGEPVFKGIMQEHHHRDVEKDIVHLRDVEVKSEWKSTKHVMENLSSLGEGISVFVIYTPNPDDPCQAPPGDKAVQRNKVLMLRLIFDLEHHGFHVLSDIHLGDTEPSNWLKWYVSRILQCNYVLMVCSPAFKEVFQETNIAGKIVDEKTRRLMEYSNAIYSELEKSNSNRMKFLPVILDHYSKGEAVPVLFQAGTVYHIGHEDSPRKFDYDNRSRDFERLVCVLAGIDRNKLDQPKLGEVKLLANPYEIRNIEVEMKERHARMLTEHSAGLMQKEEFRSPSSAPVAGGGGGGWPGRQPDVFPSQPPAMPARIGLAQSVHHSAQPHPHYQPPPQPLPYYQPAQQPYPHHQQGQQPHPYYQQAQATQPPDVESPELLPSKIPDKSIFLWLSGEILSWKFIARGLGLSEADIETIERDHHGVMEHKFQMFVVWERRYFQDCTYRKLGRVLQESEKNRNLYPEYVSRVKVIEH